MQGTVSRLSKFGLQLNNEDKWYNLSKYEKGLTLDGLNKGDVVEYETNAKGFLTKLSKSSGAVPNETAAAGSTQQKKEDSANSGAGYSDSNAANGKDLRITRLSAASTAFAALPSLKTEGQSVSELLQLGEELAERLTQYALTGKFDVVGVKETANA